MAPDAIQSRRDLAQALTTLRSQSGLTVRELARRLDTPVATVGDYVSGRHLPGPAQLPLFKALLHECGVSEQSLSDWIDALGRVRQTSDGRVARGPAPYRGLEPFDVDDARLFFGRQAATDELLARLRPALNGSAEAAWPLIVVGPSGSGKSSLLRAGLAARVAAGALDGDGVPRTVTVMTPDKHPSEKLARLTAPTAGIRRLVIVDQFEELFGASQEEQKRFLTMLATLRPPDAVVVLALRADFYAEATREPALLPALRQSQVLIGPLTDLELRAAIVEPARSVGAEVDEALVEVLLADLAPGSPTGFAHASGALPLLSHALLVTWERAHRNHLTVADYKAAGGLRGAVSQSAENLYGKLTGTDQDLTRRMFCRLVRIDDDGPFTRRRVSPRELAALAAVAGDESQPTHPRVLDRFISARLVTAGADTLEISHEALLDAWPRLAGWLARDRAGLRVHRQLTEAANAWADADGDDAQLLRGTRLQVIAEWAADTDHADELNATERRFLDESVARTEAERAATRRRTRRTQQLAGLIAALALAAVALAVVALNARQSAVSARDQAQSRQVAIEATNVASTDPALAMQLALAAFRISPTTQATSALLDSSAGEMPTRVLGPIGPTALTLDGSGQSFAVVSGEPNQARLYRLGGNLPHRTATFTIGHGAGQTYAATLNPRGRLLAIGAASGALTLWDVSTPGRPMQLARQLVRGGVNGLAFSTTGGRLAVAAGTGTISQWSLRGTSAPIALPPLSAPGHPSLRAVAYSPNGQAIAAVGDSGELDVWNLAGGRTRLVTRLTVAPSQMTTVAYSPDGSTLIAGAHDATLWHWPVGPTGAPVGPGQPLHGFANWIDSVAFSHDGRYLAAGSSDNSARIWQTSDWTDIATLPDVSPVDSIGFTVGDQAVATVDENGTTRLWPFPPPASYQTVGAPYTIDYTAGGRELAAVTGGSSGQVQLWNTSDPWRPYHFSSITMPAAFGPVAAVGALTPDGKLLTVGDAKADVQLYALDSAGHGHPVGPVLTGAHPSLEQLNFTPDAHLMSVGDDAGMVHLYDVTDPANPRLLAVIDRNGASSNVYGVSYSPDGKLLAIGCNDHHVWLWDISNPRHPRRLAVLGGFSSAVYATTFSPDGRTLIAGGSDDTVRLWDIGTPAHPRPLGVPLSGPTDTVYQTVVSPDGHTLAGSTTGGEVWLWNIEDRNQPRLLATLHAASGLLYDLTFSPDDQTLVAGSSTQTMTFWHYHPEAIATRICDVAGSPIDRTEWARYLPGIPYNPPCP
ncbi:MAG: helix-turn-helix domain-containing protein [Actinobacteria bacterium]|nr:helix-turn-helix domain-containing protein [Actinomycetota bacterium]